MPVRDARRAPRVVFRYRLFDAQPFVGAAGALEQELRDVHAHAVVVRGRRLLVEVVRRVRRFEHPVEALLHLVAHLGRYYRSFEEDAVYDDPWKLILRSGDEVELYDIRADPAETTEVSAEHPDGVSRMRAALEEHERTNIVTGRADAELDDETRSRLEQLGYIQ